MKTSLTATWLCAVVIACGPPTQGLADWDPAAGAADTSLSARFAALSALDPAVDARAAIRRRDYRLFAISGFTVTAPGIRDLDAYARRYGVRRILGTIDATSTTLESQYKGLAATYAARYNELILAALPEQWIEGLPPNWRMELPAPPFKGSVMLSASDPAVTPGRVVRQRARRRSSCAIR